MIKNPQGKSFTWSPSALGGYPTCPKQYAARYFYCTLPWVETAQMRAGTIEHKHLENRMREKTPLPEGYERGERFCRVIEQAGEVKAEQKLAINRDLKIVGYFAKDVWGRCVIDVSAKKDTPWAFSTGKRATSGRTPSSSRSTPASCPSSTRTSRSS